MNRYILNDAQWAKMEPYCLGKWNTVFKRYRDWINVGVFEQMFAVANEDVDMEYAMIDGTIVKFHRHGQGAKGGLINSP